MFSVRHSSCNRSRQQESVHDHAHRGRRMSGEGRQFRWCVQKCSGCVTDNKKVYKHLFWEGL